MAKADIPEVLLIGDPPAEGFHSMDIYADALELALRQQAEFLVRRFRWRDEPTGRGKIGRIGLLYYNRFIRYPRQLTGQRADIFHILDQSYAHLIARLPHQRTIITCHDLIPIQLAANSRIPGRWLTVQAFRASIRHLPLAARVLADSRATTAALRQYTGCKADRIDTVPLGVAPQFLTTAADCRHPAGEPFVVLQVGATAELYKNIIGSLHAFALLARRHPGKVRLIKIGKDYTPSQQRFLQRHGLRAIVRELGFVPRPQLPDMYRRADVLLMPSLLEGFGMPILESLACGTPVVTSRRGSIPEVAGSHAIYVNPDDPCDIARGLELAMKDRGLVARLRSGGVRWASRYTWRAAARATAGHYHGIIQTDNKGVSA